VEDLSEQNIGKPLRRRIELLARESLRKAIQDQRNKKGKHKMEITEEQHLNWMCQIGECAKVRRAMRADLAGDHLRNVHDASEEKCMEMSRCLQEISDHGEGGVILGNDRIYWRP
jgi:hypothetical protein